MRKADTWSIYTYMLVICSDWTDEMKTPACEYFCIAKRSLQAKLWRSDSYSLGNHRLNLQTLGIKKKPLCWINMEWKWGIYKYVTTLKLASKQKAYLCWHPREGLRQNPPLSSIAIGNTQFNDKYLSSLRLLPARFQEAPLLWKYARPKHSAVPKCSSSSRNTKSRLQRPKNYTRVFRLRDSRRVECGKSCFFACLFAICACNARPYFSEKRLATHSSIFAPVRKWSCYIC